MPTHIPTVVFARERKKAGNCPILHRNSLKFAKWGAYNLVRATGSRAPVLRSGSWRTSSRHLQKSHRQPVDDSERFEREFRPQEIQAQTVSEPGQRRVSVENSEPRKRIQLPTGQSAMKSKARLERPGSVPKHRKWCCRSLHETCRERYKDN